MRSGSKRTFVIHTSKFIIFRLKGLLSQKAHIRQTRNAYVVLTGKSHENRSFGTCVCKGGCIINMDIDLNETWTELNWLIVGPSSVNIVMHH